MRLLGGDRSHPQITADFDIGNKTMVGDSLREALKTIFVRTEFRIHVQTDSLRYVLLTNFPYQKFYQSKISEFANRRKHRTIFPVLAFVRFCQDKKFFHNIFLSYLKFKNDPLLYTRDSWNANQQSPRPETLLPE